MFLIGYELNVFIDNSNKNLERLMLHKVLIRKNSIVKLMLVIEILNK